MRNVLDSSAMLAVLFAEEGAEVVWPLLKGALMSSVNASEVLRVMQRRGASFAEAVHVFRGLPLQVKPFDMDDAAAAAGIGYSSPFLSFGDCACIATARRESATVWTADRIWAKNDLGIQVKLIR